MGRIRANRTPGFPTFEERVGGGPSALAHERAGVRDRPVRVQFFASAGRERRTRATTAIAPATTHIRPKPMSG